jgi:hypothetical protein
MVGPGSRALGRLLPGPVILAYFPMIWYQRTCGKRRRSRFVVRLGWRPRRRSSGGRSRAMTTGHRSSARARASGRDGARSQPRPDGRSAAGGRQPDEPGRRAEAGVWPADSAAKCARPQPCGRQRDHPSPEPNEPEKARPDNGLACGHAPIGVGLRQPRARCAAGARPARARQRRVRARSDRRPAGSGGSPSRPHWGARPAAVVPCQ